MSYAVHYRDADGVVHLEDVGSQDEALQLVERLRNQEGPTDLRVFDEVPIEVRTYYKVVAVAPDPSAAPAATDVPTSPAGELGTTEPVAGDEPVAGGSTDDGHPTDAPSDDDTPVRVPTPPSPFDALDVPSGAVVMSPPLTHAEDVSEEPAPPAAEPRRQLFSRG